MPHMIETIAEVVGTLGGPLAAGAILWGVLMRMARALD